MLYFLIKKALKSILRLYGGKDPSELHIKGKFDLEKLLATAELIDIKEPKNEEKKTSIDKTIKSLSLKELIEKDIEKPHTVAENMLYQGLTILAGAPKVGKSWACLDLGKSVCNGEPFLGFKTNKCDCLYLALEDSYYRLQGRAKKILKTGETVPEGFRLNILASPLNEGLLEELESHLKKFPNTKLIIIDTLQKIRGNQSGADSTYSYDYKEMTKLKSFADEHKICILLIHHLRKMKDSDVFNQISGSTGLAGATDTQIILSKTENKKEILFSIQGRDVESTEKLLTFNKKTFKWEVICDDLEAREDRTDIDFYESNPIIITINKLLEENPEGVKITSTELLEKIIEITKTKPFKTGSALTKHINSKLKLDLLYFGGIHYEQPPENGGASGRNMFFSKIKKDI